MVSGAGDIKLTKDGNVLLHEMSLNHPTASLIAKVNIIYFVKIIIFDTLLML